jgi:nucleoside-diphosphate-sugar epimerase
MGSFLEYGPSATPFREDMVCQPPEIYSISKLAQTLLTQSYGLLKKVPTTAFRLFTPYGPHIQKGRLIENVITKSLKGEDMHLTAKSVSRDFIFVDDIIDIFFETIENPEKHAGEVYNLGTGHPRNLEEVVTVVQQQTGTRSKPVWGEFTNVLYDTDTCTASMDKVFGRFSWRPKTSFEAGITQTINSIKSTL